MSLIVDFITNYADVIIVAFGAGGIGYFTMPTLKAKIKKDGFQPTDITEAVSEGTIEYQDAMKQMYDVAKDITVNDKDTVNFVIDMIEKFRKFK